MNNKTKLYQCPAYLFCNYELLEKSTPQIAEECEVGSEAIRRWLIKFNIRIRTLSEAKIGKKNPNYGRTGYKHPNYGKTGVNATMYGVHRYGEKAPNWKGDDIRYLAIHRRAHKIDPKPKDGKCKICNQVADKEGKTKLVHSNKDHSYRLPINPDEWWWIHYSCHKGYDWTPEKRKEQSERFKKMNKENNPMKRPEVIEKAQKTKAKNRANKSIKPVNPEVINSSQVSYWLK